MNVQFVDQDGASFHQNRMRTPSPNRNLDERYGHHSRHGRTNVQFQQDSPFYSNNYNSTFANVSGNQQRYSLPTQSGQFQYGNHRYNTNYMEKRNFFSGNAHRNMRNQRYTNFDSAGYHTRSHRRHHHPSDDQMPGHSRHYSRPSMESSHSSSSYVAQQRSGTRHVETLKRKCYDEEPAYLPRKKYNRDNRKDHPPRQGDNNSIRVCITNDEVTDRKCHIQSADSSNPEASPDKVDGASVERPQSRDTLSRNSSTKKIKQLRERKALNKGKNGNPGGSDQKHSRGVSIAERKDKNRGKNRTFNSSDSSAGCPESRPASPGPTQAQEINNRPSGSPGRTQAQEINNRPSGSPGQTQAQEINNRPSSSPGVAQAQEINRPCSPGATQSQEMDNRHSSSANAIQSHEINNKPTSSPRAIQSQECLDESTMAVASLLLEVSRLTQPELVEPCPSGSSSASSTSSSSSVSSTDGTSSNNVSTSSESVERDTHISDFGEDANQSQTKSHVDRPMQECPDEGKESSVNNTMETPDLFDLDVCTNQRNIAEILAVIHEDPEFSLPDLSEICATQELNEKTFKIPRKQHSPLGHNNNIEAMKVKGTTANTIITNELMKKWISCTCCGRVFNRAVICEDYNIKLNRPLQCVCTCLLCRQCYVKDSGCGLHRVLSKNAPVCSVVDEMASCVEEIGSWDLEPSAEEPLTITTNMRKLVADVLAVKGDIQLESLKKAFQELLKEQQAENLFKYPRDNALPCDNALPAESAYRLVCLPLLPGFWDRVILGNKESTNLDAMISPHSELTRFFNVHSGDYTFHWCSFVLKSQLILTMWMSLEETRGEAQVFSLVDKAVEMIVAGHEFKHMTYSLMKWFTVHYLPYCEKRNLCIVFETDSPDKVHIVKMITMLSKQLGVKDLKTKVNYKRASSEPSKNTSAKNFFSDPFRQGINVNCVNIEDELRISKASFSYNNQTTAFLLD